ncbi:MAG: hypothetical protein JWN02_643 [Acidobacteria bacterium]|nr:hypothetical protein [Acidobacteriota bacterium]
METHRGGRDNPAAVGEYLSCGLRRQLWRPTSSAARQPYGGLVFVEGGGAEVLVTGGGSPG